MGTACVHGLWLLRSRRSPALRLWREGWQRGARHVCLAYLELRPTALGLLQANERAAVSRTEYSHQRGKADARVLGRVRPDRKADRVNAHAPIAGGIFAVDYVDAFH